MECGGEFDAPAAFGTNSSSPSLTTEQLVIGAPAAGLPDLLRRPLPRPLLSDVRVASRPIFLRLDFDQVLNLEPATPEQSEPVAMGQAELDAYTAWPFEPIHPERWPQQPVARGQIFFLRRAERE